MTLYTFYGAKDLGLPGLSFEKLPAYFVKYPRKQLFELLVRINHTVSNSAAGSADLITLERELLSKNALMSLCRARAILGNRKPRIEVLCRQQILTAIKFALLFCDNEDHTTENEPITLSEIGDLLLSISDLLPGKRSSSSALLSIGYETVDDYDLLVALIPSYNLENREHFATLLARQHRLYYEQLSTHLKAPSEHKDTSDYFELKCMEFWGLQPKHLFLLTIHLIQSLWEYSGIRSVHSPAINRSELSEEYGLSKTAFNNLLEFAAYDVGSRDLTVFDGNSDFGLTDFSLIRHKPFAYSGDLLYVVDPFFAAEAAGSNLVRRLDERLSAGDRGKLHTALGKAFEDFCRDLLVEAGSGKFSILCPKSTAKNVDAELDYGKTRVFMEIYHGLWKEKSTIQPDREDLQSEFEKLFKKVKQIGERIKDVLRSKTELPSVIQPVLVCLERSTGCNFVQRILNQELKRVIGSVGAEVNFPGRVSRLIVLNSEDFQSICEMVRQGQSLQDLLELILAEDPDGSSTVAACMVKRNKRFNMDNIIDKAHRYLLEVHESLSPPIKE